MFLLCPLGNYYLISEDWKKPIDFNHCDKRMVIFFEIEGYLSNKFKFSWEEWIMMKGVSKTKLYWIFVKFISVFFNTKI